MLKDKSLEELIRENKNIVGIIEVDTFSTWFNNNCAIVINRVIWYAVRVVICVPPSECEQERESLKIIKISEHSTLERAKIKLKELKDELEGENPILAISRGSSFSLSDAIKKISLSSSNIKYLEKFDIVWRKMPIMGYHAGIYLGNNEVAHISFKSTNSIKDLQARKSSWEEFLKGSESKLIINRVIVPFRKPELIESCINEAIERGYGKGEYSLINKNCEHFATMCVCGVPFSKQVNDFLWKRKIRRDKILEKIRKINLDENTSTSSLFEIESFNENIRDDNLVKENEILKKVVFDQLEKKKKELKDLENVNKEDKNELLLLANRLLRVRQEEIKEIEELSFELEGTITNDYQQVVATTEALSK